MNKLILFIFLIPTLSFAQEEGIIDYRDKVSGPEKTMREVNVDQKIASGKDWCEYAVAKRMDDYMNDMKRNSLQESQWALVGKSLTCLGSEPCKIAWDKVEKMISKVLVKTKEYQMLSTAEQNEKIENYNLEAWFQHKPEKRKAKSVPQLHGSTDLTNVQYVHMPLLTFEKILSQPCRAYFNKNRLEINIGPLDEVNEEQDQSYRASHWFADGMYFSLHYRFRDIHQNFLLFTPEEEIYKDYRFYHFPTNQIGVFK